MLTLFQYYAEPFILAPFGSPNDVKDANIYEETSRSVFTLLTDQLQVCRSQYEFQIPCPASFGTVST